VRDRRRRSDSTRVTIQVAEAQQGEEPPVDDQPPAEEPPADEPPVDEPPVGEQPPADEPPMDEPPSDNISEYPQDLPSVYGSCPEFQTGTVTFQGRDTDSNRTRLWVGDDPAGGALVLYFHGCCGGSPSDAVRGIGESVIDAITSDGGVVAAPDGHYGPYDWYISNGDTREDNLRLIDEIVACAIQEAGVDPRRIHATGFSAGATLTSDMIHRRSNYLASGSPKSGGFDQYNPVPRDAEPENHLAAMIFHGGSDDNWGNPPYEFYNEQSVKLANILRDEGRFVVMCDHGRGHREPTDASQAVWQFFKDHPWNTSPSPYEESVLLPGNFPSYCEVW
jgi:dienelactone hydrolase